MAIRILHLDDDIQFLERFAKILSKETILGERIIINSVEKGSELTARLKRDDNPDIIIVDFHLEGEKITGAELAGISRKLSPGSAIFIASNSKDLRSIRSSLKMGADDFLAKDAKPSDIVERLESVLKTKREVKVEVNQALGGKNITGRTMSAIRLRVPQIIQSAVNCVYVQGESGTGKEVVAALFEAALGAKIPFVQINCGAISSSLVASELFGYAKGAFTGAATDKMGLIEAANGGWIFLDEIATLPLDAQVYLLRAIDSQAIRRIGTTAERPVSFRIVSATNEPLEELVAQGKFRRDLWQRLQEVKIDLAPLRDRRDEIPELVDFFTQTMRGGPFVLASSVLEALCGYDWREGNVRELRNCLRAMTEKSVNKTLTPNSIPDHIWDAIEGVNGSTRQGSQHHMSSRTLSQTGSIHQEPRSSASAMTVTWDGERPEFEKLIDKLLIAAIKVEFNKNGRMSTREASRLLGIPRSTMSNRCREIVDSGAISSEDLGKFIQISPNLKKSS